MEYSQVTLGKKIRALRDELGMSQAQLAAQAELSQGYLSQLENDEVAAPPGVGHLEISRSRGELSGVPGAGSTA